MTETVVADGVEKTYGDTVALDGVSLSVEAGEVFALIGPNGAGKTTLVRALTGTTTPDSGTVAVFGASPAAVATERLGVLPQSFSPPGRLTARELVDYYAGLYDEARAPGEVLAAVGMDEAGDTRYEDLSGGQQRRVCLGVALVNDPDLLFLDEPTAAIDPAGRRTVRRRIETLSGGGTTVVLTTHDMDEAERVADRVGLLADGELVAVGTPEELVAAHGGDARLVVEPAGETTPETAAEPLEAAGYRVETTEAGVRVYGIDPTDVGRVAGRLDDAGVAYDALSWAEPTLEDVYLALTGETVDPTSDRVPAEGRA